MSVLTISAAGRDGFENVDEQQLELLAHSLASALRHADDAARAAKLRRERTDALAALEVSARRFRLTFENSPTGLILSGLEPHNSGRYLQANPAMTTITGYSADRRTGV